MQVEQEVAQIVIQVVQRVSRLSVGVRVVVFRQQDQQLHPDQ